jgi:adenosylcobyric acid synthase
MSARAIMVLGTASHVGKSLMTAALCRIFARAGYSVAPFKAQNMSLNSAATPDGFEIGRAQALQAEAAGIAPSVHMNPILIKPSGDCSSQIVVRGKVWGNLDARTYHKQRVMTLLPVVEESYRHLASMHEIVVLEGAGSPAEINLKDNDIVNMRMAKLADAQCLLVGDIDRGGVFASLLGTCELLDKEERERIRGFVVNKFRGDRSLLEPGIRMMQERMRMPCMGVIPWLDKLDLDEEDSAGFAERIGTPWDQPPTDAGLLRIAVIAFPSISNFTDFAPLLAEPSVSLRYVREPEHLAGAGIVILPGSKQTIGDLRWLRERGFEPALQEHALSGSLLVGICGGFQMLGESIHDPLGMESRGSARGLGLLPVRTTMTSEKTTIPASGTLKEAALFGIEMRERHLRGYEIHMGESEYLHGSISFSEIRRSNSEGGIIADGCISRDRHVFGTYLHGIFDDDPFRHAFLAAARAALGLPASAGLQGWRKHREQELDRLADTFAGALDLNFIMGLLNLPTLRSPREVTHR